MNSDIKSICYYPYVPQFAYAPTPYSYGPTRTLTSPSPQPNNPESPQVHSVTPIYHDVPISAELPEAKAQVVPKNPELKFRINKTGNYHAIVLRNVVDPYSLSAHSENLKLIKQEPTPLGNMAFNYRPDGNTHQIKIMDQGVIKFKLNIRPKIPKVLLLQGAKPTLQINNLFNKNDLCLKSDNKNLEWNLERNKIRHHSYLLNFDGKGQIHNIILESMKDGKPIEVKNSRMKLIPQEMLVPNSVTSIKANSRNKSFFRIPPKYMPSRCK